MIDRITILRWGVIGGIVAAVGVAGAATRLMQPSTGDACLCTPDTLPPNDLSSSLQTASKGTGSLGYRPMAAAGSTSAAGPLGAFAPVTALASSSLSTSSASSAASGGGFGGALRTMGGHSSTSTGHAPALGGLWRLMSLSRRAPAAKAAAAVQRAAVTRAPRSATPRTGSGSSSSPAPTLVPPTLVPTITPSVAPVSDLFAENGATIGELLGNGGAGASAISPGGARASSAAGPGALAATPEPGSIVLLGTGLFGVATLLRRRLT